MLRSFRLRLAVSFALTMLVVIAGVGTAATVALRVILHRQLDETLLQLAEVEALAGASNSGPDFAFHEGVFLAGTRLPFSDLTRYAELWDIEGRSVTRSANLGDRHLPLPAPAMAAARRGAVGRATHEWDSARYRTLVYPLRLVGAHHGAHFLQVAAPLAPVDGMVWRFAGLAALLGLAGGAVAFGGAFLFARLATLPAQEIAAQAEAIEAGTLSARITAHATVTEYASLVAVLNAMLDRLDRAFETQRRFVADASHELRSPLTVLRGDLDVALRRERSPQEYRETLERMREETARITALAENLLILARADAGLPTTSLADVDLADVAERVVLRAARQAEAAGIILAVETASAVAPVRGDAALLERAVGNLVENAVRYVPRGSRVTVRCSRSGGLAALDVEDDGPGIPAEHAPLVFERFYRGDPARGRDAGTGLGLPIARAIAEAHGGRLTLERASPGALFRLLVPAVLEASPSA
jgi:two-component system OmpR family sensor kinase